MLVRCAAAVDALIAPNEKTRPPTDPGHTLPANFQLRTTQNEYDIEGPRPYPHVPDTERGAVIGVLVMEWLTSAGVAP
jgi:hypothetical protein